MGGIIIAAAAEVKEMVEEEEVIMREIKVFTTTAMEEEEGIVEGTILVGDMELAVNNTTKLAVVVAVVIRMTIAIQQRLEIALSAVFQLLPKLYQRHHPNHALRSMARQR